MERKTNQNVEYIEVLRITSAKDPQPKAIDIIVLVPNKVCMSDMSADHHDEIHYLHIVLTYRVAIIIQATTLRPISKRMERTRPMKTSA